MKRRILASILGLAVSVVSSHATGLVYFNTYVVNSYAGAYVFHGPGSAGPVGTPIWGVYNAQLVYYLGTLTDPAGNGEILGSFNRNAAVVSPYFAWGVTDNIVTPYVIPDYVSGPVTFEMLVFTGPTYATSNIRGHSAAFTLPSIATGTQFPSILDGLADFSISAVCTSSPPPIIIQQPADQAVSPGSTAVFSVVAESAYPDLTYQWLYNRWGDPGMPIAGATNSTLVVSNVNGDVIGAYSVAVCGCGCTLSSNAFLSLVVCTSGLPQIIQQPADQAVPAGSDATFSVVAQSSYPYLLYQWFFKGTAIAQATNSTLVVSNVQSNKTGAYWVMVSYGSCSITSSNANLRLYTAPVITQQPQSATGYWGKSVSFRVVANGAPAPTYLWYKDGLPLAWATSDLLQLNNLALSDAGRYWVVVSNSQGSGTSAPPALLTIAAAGVAVGFHPFLTISGAVSSVHEIQYSANLADTNAWITVTNLTLTEPVQEWMDTNVDATTDPKTYYRVIPIP
jgi:hypothetical protein